MSQKKYNFLMINSKIIVSLIFATCVFSCKNFTNSEISKGTIEYDVTYPNPAEITMSMDLMPKTVIYHFNENNSNSEISAGLGALKTTVLTDFSKKSIIQTLNLLGKKYMVEFNKAQIDSMNKAEPEMEMEHTEETKKIAGYDCKRVKCTTRDNTGAIVNFDIYYTQSIKSPNVNWFSNYSSIDGMLMEYLVKRYGITMKLTAKSVSPDGADDSVFKLEGDYKRIPPTEMDGYFKMY